MPSNVLSTTTCTFIPSLILHLDVAGTATPTPSSNSTNLIYYATTSADKKRSDAVDPRLTMAYTFDKPSLSLTPCPMNGLGA